MSVKVNNVTKIYGRQKALNEVSFEIFSGQVVGFLGPNGAGKSTMMKIITCFLPATSGSVQVNGHDTQEESIAVRKNVGYLPEHNPLYLDMYVIEYLSFVAGLHMPRALIPKRVNEMIDLTGLEIEKKKKIGALSKGYRQRVGLAQALIHDPGVLVLDEPTSGLDPNQLVEIRGLIRNIGKEKTVILSTHIMQEVEAICNRVIIINKGEICADDSTEALQQRMAGETILLVEFDKPVIESLLRSIPGLNGVEYVEGNKWKLKSITSRDIRADVFRFAVENNLAILNQQKESQSLEDIFQQLTASN
jgi:ABC-2 type transport system ATP-binding protein